MKTYAMIALTALLGWIGMPQLKAQSFYWFGNQQITLQQDPTRAALFLTVQMDILPGAGQPQVESVVMQNDLRGAYVHLNSPWTGSLAELASYLGLTPAQLSSATFGYTFGPAAGDFLFPTEKVVLYTEQPGMSNNPELLQAIQQLGLSILSDDGQRMVLSSTNANTTLSKSNTLRDLPQVRWAEPSFYAPIELFADPLYPEQYYLNNTGQVIDGVAGAVDADIDAPDAWGITTGNSAIKVAVIDQGVENHPDLNDAGGATRVLPGYPADGFGGGRPGNSSHKHGQACAGIIAATHNNIGVRGVAPDIKILPINLWNTTLSTTDVANCFNWARLNGADVISNSWGFTSCTFVSNDVVQAITDARTLGRSGKGCVVVFAAGNDYNSCINFPSNVTGVLAVAALNKTGARSTYSNYGTGLGVSAFGGGVPGDIRTLDRVGAAGYGPGDYYNNFNGTSAACPQVSGVAALILSVASTWTETEVVCRIKEGATDIVNPTYGYDTGYGAGRLNAYYSTAIHNLNLIDATVPGYQHYAADQHITSGAGCTVLNNARLSLTAGQSVTLNPGFSTDAGAYLLAEINTTGPCGSGPRDEEGHLLASGIEFPTLGGLSEDLPSSSIAKTGIERIYPNPFSSTAIVEFSLQETTAVQLIIFDATGKKVAEFVSENPLEPGIHQWTLNGNQLLPGMYYCRLQAGKTAESRKLVLVR